MLARHYRTAWEWTETNLQTAQRRGWAGGGDARWPGRPVRTRPAPWRRRCGGARRGPGHPRRALAAVDDWAERGVHEGGAGHSPGAAGVLARALDALLGVRL